MEFTIDKIDERFSLAKPGLQSFLALKRGLIEGNVDLEEVLYQYNYELHILLLQFQNNSFSQIRNYPEIVPEQLQVQISLFRSHWTCATVDETAKCLRDAVPEVRVLFPQIENLVRLLLVRPVSSCEAERSFSALRRLKTWLRSSMTQVCLNSVTLCHVHQNILDELDCSYA